MPGLPATLWQVPFLGTHLLLSSGFSRSLVCQPMSGQRALTAWPPLPGLSHLTRVLSPVRGFWVPEPPSPTQRAVQALTGLVCAHRRVWSAFCPGPDTPSVLPAPPLSSWRRLLISGAGEGRVGAGWREDGLIQNRSPQQWARGGTRCLWSGARLVPAGGRTYSAGWSGPSHPGLEEGRTVDRRPT